MCIPVNSGSSEEVVVDAGTASLRERREAADVVVKAVPAAAVVLEVFEVLSVAGRAS